MVLLVDEYIKWDELFFNEVWFEHILDVYEDMNHNKLEVLKDFAKWKEKEINPEECNINTDKKIINFVFGEDGIGANESDSCGGFFRFDITTDYDFQIIDAGYSQG